MGFKRVAVTALLMMALVAVVGCGGKTAKEDPAQAAQKVAEEFYRSWYLNADWGRAYDLADPAIWGPFPWAQSRDAFVADAKAHGITPGRDGLPTDAPLRITKFDRAGDWAFLIQDAREGHVIWVTNTAHGWKVRKKMNYEEGMTIPWS